MQMPAQVREIMPSPLPGFLRIFGSVVFLIDCFFLLFLAYFGDKGLYGYGTARMIISGLLVLALSASILVVSNHSWARWVTGIIASIFIVAGCIPFFIPTESRLEISSLGILFVCLYTVPTFIIVFIKDHRHEVAPTEDLNNESPSWVRITTRILTVLFLGLVIGSSAYFSILYQQQRSIIFMSIAGILLIYLILIARKAWQLHEIGRRYLLVFPFAFLWCFLFTLLCIGISFIAPALMDYLTDGIGLVVLSMLCMIQISLTGVAFIITLPLWFRRMKLAFH